MLLLIQYTLIFSSVLTLVALGGCISEHSGVINLGLEGIMVIGALGGALTRGTLASPPPSSRPPVISGRTSPIWTPSRRFSSPPCC